MKISGSLFASKHRRSDFRNGVAGRARCLVKDRFPLQWPPQPVPKH